MHGDVVTRNQVRQLLGVCGRGPSGIQLLQEEWQQVRRSQVMFTVASLPRGSGTPHIFFLFLFYSYSVSVNSSWWIVTPTIMDVLEDGRIELWITCP